MPPGLAFLRQAHLGAVVHARGNVDLELALAAQIAFALALLAGPANDLAAPAALGAGAAHGKKRLLIDHFAAAAAGGASDQSVFRLGAFALAAAAFFQARNLNVGGQAAHRIFEADFQIVADIFAALGPVAALLARASAEHVAESEHVAEDVAQVGESGGRIEAVAGRGGHALMAEAVIRGALLRIARTL